MYIQPNSTVLLLAGVPLNSDYIHTLTWESAQDQYNYFRGKAVHSFFNLTYQRYSVNSIKVEGSVDTYYNIDYMMFQNTNYSNRWFYAFVEDVTYINDNLTEITYTLDVLQTWYFDYTLQECFVEREHPVGDSVGDNLLPENLEIGEYMIHEMEYVGEPFYRAGWSTIADERFASKWYMLTTEPLVEEDTYNDNKAGSIRNGVMCGLYFHAFAEATEVQGYIDGLTQQGKQEIIFSIFQAPAWFNLGTQTASIGYTAAKRNATFGAYVPRNKKLLTYPYKSLTLASSDGSVNVLRYEFFSENPTTSMNVPSFYTTGVLTPMPEAICYPLNYNGDGSNLLESVSVKNFPTVAVVNDSFTAWYAQNKNSINATLNNTRATANLAAEQNKKRAQLDAVATGTQGLWNVASAVMGMGGLSQRAYDRQVSTVASRFINAGSAVTNAAYGMMGDYLSSKQGFETAGQQIANAEASALAAQEDHKAVPDGVIGHASSAGAFYAINACGFRLYHNTIRREFAEKIDKYFDKYGYSTKQVKIPNRRTRPHWNYVKTIGCSINGSIPNTHKSAIEQIYNNGITFWKNPVEVGNYSLDNRPGQ